MKYVLDANIAIGALNRVDTVQQALAGVPASDFYGQTRAALERRGLVKTDFDLVIACTALSLNATLVTNDQSLLDGSIANLQTENWLSDINLR